MTRLPAPTDVLPHRPPFLFVDRCVQCSEDQVVAEYDFRGDEAFFAGHFPGNPVVPGVLLIEGLAQSLAYLALRNSDDDMVVLTGVEADKIRRPVRPGETVRYTVRIIRKRMKLVMAEGLVEVGDERVLRAKLKGFMGPPRDRPPVE
jgi:3-hydroxyacyl-[acyl-carrier-protein] dehydratase